MSTHFANASPGNVTIPTYRGSHRVSVNGDRVRIHDLELFTGFDPDIDVGNARMKAFDADTVRKVIEQTRKYAERGQLPKVILGHNPDDPDGKPENPALGDVLNVRFAEIHGVPGMVGDVDMAIADFEAFVRSNRYPRRSIEFQRGALRQVALLGANAPGRPIPDTKFNEQPDIEAFTRPVPTTHFLESDMTTNAPDIKAIETENATLKASLADATKERDTLKASLAEVTRERDSLRTGANDEVVKLRAQVDGLNDKFRETQIDRILDSMHNEGYRVGGDHRAGFVGMFKASENWQETEKFIRATVKQDPINRTVSTAGAIVDGTTDANSAESVVKMREIEMKAVKAATDRMAREGLYGSKDHLATFEKFVEEERNKLTAK